MKPANSLVLEAAAWRQRELWEIFEKAVWRGVWPFKPWVMSIEMQENLDEHLRFHVTLYDVTYTVYPDFETPGIYDYTGSDHMLYLADLTVKAFHKLQAEPVPGNIVLGED